MPPTATPAPIPPFAPGDRPLLLLSLLLFSLVSVVVSVGVVVGAALVGGRELEVGAGVDDVGEGSDCLRILNPRDGASGRSSSYGSSVDATGGLRR